MMKNSLTVMAVCLSVCCVAWQPATADVVFQIEDGGTLDVLPGSTGTLDVLMVVPSEQSLAGYETLLHVSPPNAGFDFALPTEEVLDLVTFVSEFNTGGDPSSLVTVGEGTATLPAGSTVLYRLQYTMDGSVAPGTTFSVNFDPADDRTYAFDGNLQPLGRTLQGATVAAIPEPSAFLFIGVIGLIVGAGRLSRVFLSRQGL